MSDIPKPYKPVTVRFTTGGRQCQVHSPTCKYGARDSTEAKTWADRLNDAYAAGWVARGIDDTLNEAKQEPRP